MNLLDENIPLDQRDLLRAWGIHCRLIKAQRMGSVARAHHDGIHFWRRNEASLSRAGWPRGR